MWEKLLNYWSQSAPVLPEAIAFYILATIAILFGFLVVANPFSRAPINSGLSLLCTILSLAGMAILLRAYFLAAILVIIYGGAVVVLFLFVLMLSRKDFKIVFAPTRIRFAIGMIITILFAMIIVPIAIQIPVSTAVSDSVPIEGTVSAIGTLLLTKYIIPFEAISILLLSAIIGVVYLSKPETKGKSK